MKIPAELVNGDSGVWDDIPTSDNVGNPIDSSGYDLIYSIRGAKTLDLTAAAQGTGWRTSISSTQSVTLDAGDYFWQAYAQQRSPGTARITIGSGQLTVKPNLKTATAGFDGRSQIQQDLDAVQAAMRAMVAGGAVQEYTIAGRSLRKIALAELMVLESQLKAQLFRERKANSIKNGLGNPGNAFVRFR
jgi:hypothetical protein